MFVDFMSSTDLKSAYLAWSRCHFQAVSMIVSSPSNSGAHPRTRRAFAELQTSVAGSPARLGASRAMMVRPVTFRAAARTSCTEKPLPLPRLNTPLD